MPFLSLQHSIHRVSFYTTLLVLVQCFFSTTSARSAQYHCACLGTIWHENTVINATVSSCISAAFRCQLTEWPAAPDKSVHNSLARSLLNLGERHQVAVAVLHYSKELHWCCWGPARYGFGDLLQPQCNSWSASTTAVDLACCCSLPWSLQALVEADSIPCIDDTHVHVLWLDIRHD